MNEVKMIRKQKETCERFGAKYLASPAYRKLGISRSVGSGVLPINGFREEPAGDTTGWYIYAGEKFSEDEDFFVPLHVEHLTDRCPEVMKYLGLSPGWRFLVAGEYEDVWFDESLLGKQ